MFFNLVSVSFQLPLLSYQKLEVGSLCYVDKMGSSLPVAKANNIMEQRSLFMAGVGAKTKW